MDPTTPCIVGVAQTTYRDVDRDAPEPLQIWAAMAKQAAEDSGGHDILSSVDSLHVVYPMSWQYDDAPARLAAQLGLKDGLRFYSGISGTTSQQFVNTAARNILAGHSEMALITSGEALATKRRLKQRGHEPDWSHRLSEERPLPFNDPIHPAELAHQVFKPYVSYAIFDVARRAHLGLSPDENRQRDGEVLARLTGIASNNPNAWFPIVQSARELIEVSPQNRMISYPYTKNMSAIMDVDMGGAILVTSHGKADALGIPVDRRVALRGFCAAQDPAYVAQRDEMWRSHSMAEASAEALRCAGIAVDDVAHLDLYSCFASSVNFALDALEISEQDTRPLTVTGGLPYFGGAGNGYTTHSIVSMVEKLREKPAEYGLVSGVGMHMQNHVFGIYSGTPGPLELPDEDAVQARVNQAKVRVIENRATGAANVVAYCVVHDREGPSHGVAVCDLPDGARCYAIVSDLDIMASMQQEEWVGRPVELIPGDGEVNLLTA
ncbi:MAG: acetyl-CoA synthetase [Myxococcales bacterium]|nr:acetyl-CoA synthetase [Myxococcales bacterium]